MPRCGICSHDSFFVHNISYIKQHSHTSNQTKHNNMTGSWANDVQGLESGWNVAQRQTEERNAAQVERRNNKWEANGKNEKKTRGDANRGSKRGKKASSPKHGRKGSRSPPRRRGTVCPSSPHRKAQLASVNRAGTILDNRNVQQACATRELFERDAVDLNKPLTENDYLNEAFGIPMFGEDSLTASHVAYFKVVTGRMPKQAELVAAADYMGGSYVIARIPGPSKGLRDLWKTAHAIGAVFVGPSRKGKSEDDVQVPSSIRVGFMVPSIEDGDDREHFIQDRIDDIAYSLGVNDTYKAYYNSGRREIEYSDASPQTVQNGVKAMTDSV